MMDSGTKRQHEAAETADSDSTCDKALPLKRVRRDWDERYDMFLQLKEMLTLDSSHILLEVYYEEVMSRERLELSEGKPILEFPYFGCSQVIIRCIRHQMKQNLDEVVFQWWRKETDFFFVKDFIERCMDPILRCFLVEISSFSCPNPNRLIDPLYDMVMIFTERLKHPTSRNLLLEDVQSLIHPDEILDGIERISNQNVEIFIFELAVKFSKYSDQSIDEWILLNVEFGLRKPNFRLSFALDEHTVTELNAKASERKFKFISQTKEEEKKRFPSVSDKDLYKDFVKWYRVHYYPVYKTDCPKKTEFSSRFSEVTGLPLIRIFTFYDHLKGFAGCSFNQ